MNVTINLESDALVMTFKAPWTWADFDALESRIEELFNSVPYDVDLIIDLREAGAMPESVMARLRDAYADGTDNLRQYIFVGASPEFIEAFKTADRYYTALGGRLAYTFVSSMDEARLTAMLAL